jgi:hypothetical protein
MADAVPAPTLSHCVTPLTGSDESEDDEDDVDESDMLPYDPYKLPINHEITLQVRRTMSPLRGSLWIGSYGK